MTTAEGPWRGWHEQNRASWNAVTAAHNSHKVGQAEFLASGGQTLFPEELELLGDLRGQRVVHLQCNCGQDTLCLSRLADGVVGVDISDRAVEVARELSSTTGIPATFHRGDLFGWFDTTDDRFDVAFTSYGTIGWLADLPRWARGVARVLRPEGRLVFIDFHPIAWTFTRDGPCGDSYFIDGPLRDDAGVSDYVGVDLAPSGFAEGDAGFVNPEPAYSFQWTVASLVQALADAGMRVESLREYGYANGCELFEGMRRIPGRRFALPEGQPEVPLMLGLTATTAPAGHLGGSAPAAAT